jgi:signal transduction histidine kinase
MLNLSYGQVNTRRFVQDIIDYITPRANVSEQNLTLDLPAELPDITADEQRLRQILLNLFDNAIKFTPKRGRINLSIATRNNGIAFNVSDTGCGIDKDERYQIFEPYKRLESKNNRAQGLGLGLALSKMFIELHGGHITFKSQKGKGTTFSFWLPLSPNNADIISKKGMLEKYRNEDPHY